MQPRKLHTAFCSVCPLRRDVSAQRLADDCARLTGEPCRMLPAEDIVFTRGASSRETRYQRLETLFMAANGELGVITATVEALQTRFPLREEFEKRLFRGSYHEESGK